MPGPAGTVFALTIGPLLELLAPQLEGVGPGPAGGRPAAGGVVTLVGGGGAGGRIDARTISAPVGADDGEVGAGGGEDAGGVDVGSGPGGVGGAVTGEGELGPVAA